MSFTPQFTIVERGDNLLLTLTDTTGTGADGWDGTPAVTDIDAGVNTLTLDIVYTSSTGNVTSYDTIDLFTEFGPFATTADLVFALDATLLKDNGVSLGTAGDVFPDGLYQITYTYQKSTSNLHTDYSILLDGNVKNTLYELLRTIPTTYLCDGVHERDILDIIFIKGYYDALLATASIGRSAEVINQLYVIERLVVNGSNNTW